MGTATSENIVKPRPRRLSSAIHPRVGRWYAAILGLGVVAALVASAVTGHASRVLGWLAPAAALAAATAAALGIVPLAPRDTLDGAWLDGDDIVLRRRAQTVRAPLTAVANIDADRNRNLVYLTLRVPCILGNQVRFRTRPRAAYAVSQRLQQQLRTLERTAP
jgi:hypothetical protein